MINISQTNLYVGTENDLFKSFDNPEFAVVNVAGSLHTKILGYRPSFQDSNYVLYQNDRILSANFVDTENPKYYDWQNKGVVVFTQILDFIDLHKSKNVLINCNQGISRSPSFALLYLSKRLGVINSSSFEAAKLDFLKVYPSYIPNLGIKLFLINNWDKLK